MENRNSRTGIAAVKNPLIALVAIVAFSFAFACIMQCQAQAAPRGKCTASAKAKTVKKATRLPAATVEVAYLSPDEPVAIGSNGRAEHHPEMKPVMAQLPATAEDVAVAHEGNRQAYSNVRHTPFLLTAAAGQNSND